MVWISDIILGAEVMWLLAKWEIMYSGNEWSVRKEKATDWTNIRLGTPMKSSKLLSLAVNRTHPVLPGCNYRRVPLQFHPVPVAVPGVAERNYKIFINNKSLSWVLDEEFPACEIRISTDLTDLVHFWQSFCVTVCTADCVLPSVRQSVIHPASIHSLTFRHRASSI